MSIQLVDASTNEAPLGTSEGREEAALSAALSTIRAQAEDLARLRAEVTLLRRVEAGVGDGPDGMPRDAWAARAEWREKFGGQAHAGR